MESNYDCDLTDIDPSSTSEDPCELDHQNKMPSLLVPTVAQDVHTLYSWENVSNSSVGISASFTSDVDMHSIWNTVLSEENLTSDQLQWWNESYIAYPRKGETQTECNLLPDSHLDFGGVADKINKNGNLYQCEKRLQSDQDLARQDIRRKLAWEGISQGGAADCVSKNIPGNNPKLNIHRHSQKSVLTLRNFYDNETPYPKDKQLYKLSNLTGLTMKQINTWFSNRREKKREKGTSSAAVSYKTKNNHPDAAINVLKAWVDTHHDNARPTTEEKIQLAEEANLSLKKVSYWFENYRKKQRKLAFNLQKNQPGVMEVTEATHCTSEFRAQKPRQNAEIGHPTGHEFKPLQDKDPNDCTDDWDQDLWESCMKTGHELEPLQEKDSNDGTDDWDQDLWESCIKTG